ncbi:MAG TPA: hypothetical protein DDZ88_11255 [Verrucomicrobiales bacterium]|nr:hypothetical protein [Verrucomicrobiales bacterium]
MLNSVSQHRFFSVVHRLYSQQGKSRICVCGRWTGPAQTQNGGVACKFGEQRTQGARQIGGIRP